MLVCVHIVCMYEGMSACTGVHVYRYMYILVDIIMYPPPFVIAAYENRLNLSPELIVSYMPPVPVWRNIVSLLCTKPLKSSIKT